MRVPIDRNRAFATALILLATLSAMGAGNGDSLTELDALVGRWMTLRTTLAEERRDWDARRAQWEDEIALLEQEDKTLTREIEEGSSFASSVEQERAAVLARKERMERELHLLRGVLDRAEADLKRWRLRIPGGLLAPLNAGFGALTVSPKEAAKQPLAKRAQTVAALYTQIEAMQNRFHATRESLEIDGSRRQVDVLYVGLARAFAVSPADDWAAIGTPTESGWSWTPGSVEPPAVRLAIDVLNRQATAQLVSLPMQVAEEVQP